VRSPRRVLAALLLGCCLGAAPALADSFKPVQLAITIAPVARLHASLPITVTVTADPGVLDDATAPLRIRAKLSGECGGTFATTPGDVLLDQRLNPQPTTGRAYRATAHGAGRPSAYGQRIVCAFLEEEGDDRMFANNTDDPPVVSVAPLCTRRAAAYDGARAALAGAQRRLKHARGKAARARARRRVAQLKRTASADRRSALAACGPGVPL
jgi:hypothetical protein